MKNLFSKFVEAVSNTVHGTPYERALSQLIREDDRISREGKNPAVSKSCRDLDRRCRELAAKEGRAYTPHY